MTKRILFLLLLIAAFSSCDGDSESPECQASDPDITLMDIRDFNILPSYVNALESLEALQNRFTSFSTETTSENLNLLQNELKTAWINWQSISPYQFGPAADVALQSNVNTFPVDSFSVLQRVEEQNFTLIANDTKGFPALDLLFNGIDITSEGIISIYSGAQGDNLKSYAQAVISDISEKTEQVKTVWDESYGDAFVVNTGFATGSSFSLFINAYIQDWEQIKRDRIALPLGLLTFETPLPGHVECKYGGYSQELALAHVENHYEIYKSIDHLGIQELVEEVNNFIGSNDETLDEAIVAQFELSILKLTAVPDPLSETVLSDFEIVNEAYLAMQDMVVLMKTDLTSGLGISINFADNDGD